MTCWNRAGQRAWWEPSHGLVRVCLSSQCHVRLLYDSVLQGVAHSRPPLQGTSVHFIFISPLPALHRLGAILWSLTNGGTHAVSGKSKRSPDCRCHEYLHNKRATCVRLLVTGRNIVLESVSEFFCIFRCIYNVWKTFCALLLIAVYCIRFFFPIAVTILMPLYIIQYICHINKKITIIMN